MISFGGGAVVIYDSILYQRTGTVGRWANSLERRFVMHAQMEAPSRSGELRALISGDTDLNPAAKQALVTIVSGAEHSMYVLAGTQGPIMANRLWNFRARTGLRYPRGGFNDPKRPFTSGINYEFLQANRYMMRVRAGNGFGQRYMVQVRGQDANNFLGRAADRTAVTNRSLRGFHPDFGY